MRTVHCFALLAAVILVASTGCDKIVGDFVFGGRRERGHGREREQRRVVDRHGRRQHR